MNRSMPILLTMVVLLVLPVASFGKGSPVVSTDWLEKNLNQPKLVMVDIRKVEEYREGHVPNSINVFYGVWAIKKKGLDNELPGQDDLFDILSSSGIEPDSHVVVIGKTDTEVDLMSMTRVAWTLAYAGVQNVSILDGGFNKWKKDKKPISMDVVKPKAVEYTGKVNKTIFATEDLVLAGGEKSTLVDARMPDFYFGISKLNFVEKAGHIKGAVDLPSPWIFTKEGTFKSKADLEAMASGVVGTDKSKEIITYCDSGRFCTGWWFVLKDILGYKDVKSYDGSMQELTKDPNAPVIRYHWEMCG